LAAIQHDNPGMSLNDQVQLARTYTDQGNILSPSYTTGEEWAGIGVSLVNQVSDVADFAFKSLTSGRSIIPVPFAPRVVPRWNVSGLPNQDWLIDNTVDPIVASLAPQIRVAEGLTAGRVAPIYRDWEPVIGEGGAVLTISTLSAEEFLISRGITDSALRQEIIDSGLRTELLNPELTPQTLARFDRLFVDTVNDGKSFSGRLGNIDTRVATINKTAELEATGAIPRFEFPVDVGGGKMRYVDLVGLDATTLRPTQYFQFVKADSFGTVIRPDELVAATQIENALQLPSKSVKLINTARN